MGDDDWWDYARDDYEAGLVADALREQSLEAVRLYLATHGDAVDERIQQLLADSRGLYAADYFGPSLTHSATAAELIVRFLVLRPLIQGAFLSDEWAEILTRRVEQGRSADDRELLPAIARRWDIDLAAVRLADGSPVWEFLVKDLWPTRNRHVHAGERVPGYTAAQAIEAVDLLIADVVVPLAGKLELSWPATSWHEVNWRSATGLVGRRQTFDRQSPFGRP